MLKKFDEYCDKLKEYFEKYQRINLRALAGLVNTLRETIKLNFDIKDRVVERFGDFGKDLKDLIVGWGTIFGMQVSNSIPNHS